MEVREGRGVTGSQFLSTVTGGEETVWGRNSVLGHVCLNWSLDFVGWGILRNFAN